VPNTKPIKPASAIDRYVLDAVEGELDRSRDRTWFSARRAVMTTIMTITALHTEFMFISMMTAR